MGSPGASLPTMPENPEIWKAVAMADHFEKIQKLPDAIPGVPNFRRVPGYKVYCCGQPTLAALEVTLNKVCGEIYPKTGKIIWLNMRQEPSVYINGEPVCARPPNKIGEYAELGNVTAAQLETDEAEFVRVCEGQMKAGDGKIKVLDVNKQEKTVEVKSMVTLQEAIEGLVETVPGVNLDLLKMDRYTMDPKKDALFRGEFEVIKELVSILPDGEAAKRECDKVIDKNGPAKSGGTGIKQLRENIAESKLSYEI